MDDIVEEESVEIVSDVSPDGVQQESPDLGITLNIDYTSSGACNFSRFNLTGVISDLSEKLTESPEMNGNLTARSVDDTLVLAQTELPWKSSSRISVEGKPAAEYDHNIGELS